MKFPFGDFRPAFRGENDAVSFREWHVVAMDQMIHLLKDNSTTLVETGRLEQYPKSWLCKLYIGDEILPSYMGIIIRHYKNPY